MNIFDTENKSVRRLLGYAYIFTMMLFTLIVASLSGNQINSTMRDSAVENTIKIVDNIALSSRIAIIQMSTENASTIVTSTKNIPNLDDVYILDTYGHELVGSLSNALPFDMLVNSLSDKNGATVVKENEDMIFIASPVFINPPGDTVVEPDLLDNSELLSHESRLIGYVMVKYDKAHLTKATTKARNTSIFYIIIISLALFIWLMYSLNRIVNPLNKLSDILQNPDTAKYYREVELSGSREVVDIKNSFNKLIKELKSSHESLYEYNVELETRVRERTKELNAATNEANLLNQQNRALITGMNNSLEEQNKYISRELHDNFSGDLVFMRRRLSRLRTICDKDDSANENIPFIREQTVELLDRISILFDLTRDLQKMLRPELLDSLGLDGSIEDRIQMFSSTMPDIEVVYQHEGEYKDLEYNTAIQVYRIAQECLTNIVKHANCTEVEVSLQRIYNEVADEIWLTIKDNGVGFNLSETVITGMGLASMRERALMLGGILEIKTSPGNGTIIECKIPVPHSNHQD